MSSHTLHAGMPGRDGQDTDCLLMLAGETVVQYKPAATCCLPCVGRSLAGLTLVAASCVTGGFSGVSCLLTPSMHGCLEETDRTQTWMSILQVEARSANWLRERQFEMASGNRGTVSFSGKAGCSRKTSCQASAAGSNHAAAWQIAKWLQAQVTPEFSEVVPIFLHLPSLDAQLVPVFPYFPRRDALERRTELSHLVRMPLHALCCGEW